MGQEGALTTLFNMALEGAAIKALRSEKNIAQRPTQVIACADVIALISRGRRYLEENLILKNEKFQNLGVTVNEKKTREIETTDRIQAGNKTYWKYKSS